MLPWYLVAVFALIGRCLASNEPLVQRQSADCSTLQLIIAKGTDEPGTYGDIVGGPLFNATLLLIPNVTAYVVPYPASLDCDSEAIGISDTLAYLNSSIAACPDMLYALVGYSQGADVMHHVGVMLAESVYDSIMAITLFGDPNNRGVSQYEPSVGTPNNITTGVLPSTLAARLKENCNVGDPVCTNNGSNYLAHLQYGSGNNTFISESAHYIQKQLYIRGQAGPDDSQAAAPGDQTEANINALSALNDLFGAGNATTCASATSSNLISSSTLIGGNTPTASSNAASTTASATNAGSSTSQAASSGTASSSVAVQTTSRGAPAIAAVFVCPWVLMLIPVALTTLVL